MTSRERFRKILNHEEADRVPIDLGQDMHNGLHEVAYEKLLKFLGEEDDIIIYDAIQHLAVCKDSVLERLHSDTKYFSTDSAEGFKLKYKNDVFYDEWNVGRKNSGLYHDSVDFPLNNCTGSKLRNYQPPNPVDAHRFKDVRETALRLTNETDYAVIGRNACSIFYLTSELIGFQEFMERILFDQELVIKAIDMVLEWNMKFFEKYLDYVGDLVEVVWMGDDWGTQTGPIMNPKLFSEIFVPRYKDFTNMVKSKSSAKIALHSCGAVIWAMEDIIDSGIDILHPVQGDVESMLNPAEIKEKYGDRLVFYSNLKNQTVLPYGTVEEVEKDVKEKIQALAPGGGYIMSGGHNVQADVPPENLLAIVDATLKYGTYPISG